MRASGQRLVAVTGATGQVGGRVAARLAALGVAQRLIVRDAARAPALAGAEVAEALVLRGDEPDARRAHRREHAVPGLRPRVGRPRRRATAAAVDAAVAAGVERIVYLSFLGAGPQATFTLARDHWATEEHIRASGAAFTFLRQSIYLDFMAFFAGADGRDPRACGRRAPGAGRA